MSAGWNRRDDQRLRAEGLWRHGKSARYICETLHVPRQTLLHWRWEHQWPPRKEYLARPIVEPKRRRSGPSHDVRTEPAPASGKMPERRYTLDAHGEKVSTAPGVVRYACQHCGLRAEKPNGHDHCRAVA